MQLGKEIGAEVVFLTSEPGKTDEEGQQWTNFSVGFSVRLDSLTARMEKKLNANNDELIKAIWGKLPVKRRAQLAADQDAWISRLRAEPNNLRPRATTCRNI